MLSLKANVAAAAFSATITCQHRPLGAMARMPMTAAVGTRPLPADHARSIRPINVPGRTTPSFGTRIWNCPPGRSHNVEYRLLDHELGDLGSGVDGAAVTVEPVGDDSFWGLAGVPEPFGYGNVRQNQCPFFTVERTVSVIFSALGSANCSIGRE